MTQETGVSQEQPWVVTISRQLGCGGALLGHDLASRLGVPCFDREILEHASAELKVPADVLAAEEERGKTFWQSLIESYAAGTPEGFYYPPPLQLPSTREVSEVQSAIITRLAETQNSVIVGRGAVHVLRHHPRRLSVFLHASQEFRLKRVQELYEVSAEQARQMLADSDQDRTRYHAALSSKAWTDARQYSLTLEVSAFGLAAAAELLYAAWEKRFGGGD